jgi:hypothetical protein
MPETHMLKAFADRYAAMRALVETVLAFTVRHAGQIQGLRAQAMADAAAKTHWPVHWQPDFSRPSRFCFHGYRAVYRASLLGSYQRLSYDRSQPWQADIDYFDRCNADIIIPAARAYLIPQAWAAVIARLAWNGVRLQRLELDQEFTVQSYRISTVTSRNGAYEGQLFHEHMELTTQRETIAARAGDVLVDLSQANARYAVETLEPQAHDSFFRWGFFNSVLEKKEAYSDYVFEDSALQMLTQEPDLKAKFEHWKRLNSDQVHDQTAVLDFIFANGKRYCEPEWRRYPVYSIAHAGFETQ